MLGDTIMFGISKYLPLPVIKAYYRADFLYNYYKAEHVFVKCPICDHAKSKVFHYGLDMFAPDISQGHDKFCCCNCGHLFATWLIGEDVGKLYSSIQQDEVLHENNRKELQNEMMRIGLKYSDGYNVLDFSCGANYRAAQELREEGYCAYSCDIMPGFPYDDHFFKYTDRTRHQYKGVFDAISSVDVMEHLNTPIEDFQAFNDMLVPGGYMVHFTPFIEYIPLHGSHADTAFHTCFVSNKSLKILCEKTGFKLIEKIYRHPGYWYYVFQKQS